VSAFCDCHFYTAKDLVGIRRIQTLVFIVIMVSARRKLHSYRPAWQCGMKGFFNATFLVTLILFFCQCFGETRIKVMLCVMRCGT
jgi:hypothetical protein